MANLTIVVDDELLKQARIRALEQGRSINALVREYLESFAGKTSVHERAIQALNDIADQAAGGSGGRRWAREGLYERRA